MRVTVMLVFRKISITIIGSILLLLGIIMIVLPGPAVVIIPLALTILALEYEWAKRYLKISQQMLSKSARKMDQLIRKIKRNK
jgi:uncharacterized protein (TIGR02611 family)